MAESELRRGFCPGVWAPMESGDGLIVRVRVPRGRLAARQVRGMAAAARSYGNGIVELTRRASLQLRGARWASLPDLQANLRGLGLAEASPEQEKLPSLLVCPLAGLDLRSPHLEPLAGGLRRVLARSPRASGASEKLLVVLSGGSDLFDDVHADLRVELRAEHPGLALLSVAGTRQDAILLGCCHEREVPHAMQRLLAVLAQTAGEQLRMRDVVTARGTTPLLAALEGVLGGVPGERSAALPAWSATYLGLHSQLRNWFGVELPFGSATAEDWDALAELADHFGTGELRLLPTRAVLVTGVREADREELLGRARDRHFIVERPQPSLRLVACSGAPACRSAHADTRHLATELALLLEGGMRQSATLHVSGCEKSCAWSGVADITLVHGADGCRLGFGANVAQTSAHAALSVAAVRERLSMSLGPSA
jgi:precorrin-3B synthase